jgi:hypothetical protein
MDEQSAHENKSSSPEQAWDAPTQHDLDEVHLLIDHLSGRADRKIGTVELDSCFKPGTKANLIDEVCRIQRPPADDQARAAQAAALIKARDKLNELAAPATGLTIVYTLLFAPAPEAASNGSNADYPQSLALKAYPDLERSAHRLRVWVRWLLGLMIAGVIFTSLVSWYVAYGTLVLQRIEQLDGQRAEIGAALDAIQPMPPAAGPTLPTRGAPSEAWLRDDQGLVDRLTVVRKPGQPDFDRASGAVTRLLSKHEAADQALVEWTWLPRRIFGRSLMVDDKDRSITTTERIEQWSANLLVILGNHVLPMMYGFLGAAAAVMVNLNQKVRSSRLSPRDRRMSYVQLVLGVVTGACIGLFLSPSAFGTSGAALSGRTIALSASALSFLAGFGVEGVFKMLENVLIAAFGGQPRLPPPV